MICIYVYLQYIIWIYIVSTNIYIYTYLFESHSPFFPYASHIHITSNMIYNMAIQCHSLDLASGEPQEPLHRVSPGACGESSS